jgi:hypothetical protein
MTTGRTYTIGNGVMSLVFGLLGMIDVIERQPLNASVWITFAVAFLLVGANEQPWETKPRWRRLCSVLTLILGIILFVAVIIHDYQM